jgi:hypothetical protein
MYRLCLLVFTLEASVTGNAQTFIPAGTQQTVSADATQPPSCNPDLIEGTLTFNSLPGEQVVSLHLRNTTSTACRLHGQVGASFAVDGHSMDVENCWICDRNDKPLPFEERKSGDQFLIGQGELVTIDLHWASAGAPCQWADWVDFAVRWSKTSSYLFVPSNWPLHICSPVRSSGYQAGADSRLIPAAEDGALRVSVLQDPIYSDERVTLHAERTEQTTSGEQSTGCAELYTVRQTPLVGMRFDPARTVDSSSIPSFTPEQIQEDQERVWPSWKHDRPRRCDIESDKTMADAVIDATDLAGVTHVVWRTTAAPGRQPAFLTTATHFTLLDPDTLEPNWGETVQGIRAGLSVDHPSFRVGERVRLHTRWENVNATAPLGKGECDDPEPALEIQDSNHNVLRTIPMFPGCSGHGWGPFRVPVGKPQRTFHELSTISERMGLRGTGVYYLVSVWTPPVLGGPPKPPAAGTVLSAGYEGFGEDYATARSLPVRVEILPK